MHGRQTLRAGPRTREEDRRDPRRRTRALPSRRPTADRRTCPCPTTRPGTCALLTRRHDGQLAGTAPVATGWVLVEQPGPWGRESADRVGARPGDRRGARRRRRATTSASSWCGGPGRSGDRRRQLRRAHRRARPHRRDPVGGAAEVDDADARRARPASRRRRRRPGSGDRGRRPAVLVCTHGKRDRCCATYGRPIADALAAAARRRGLGGQPRRRPPLRRQPVSASRTARCYGGLQVADAAPASSTCTVAGRFDLDHLRGRSGLPRPAQAAEVLVRRRARRRPATRRSQVTRCPLPTRAGTCTRPPRRRRVTVAARHRPTGADRDQLRRCPRATATTRSTRVAGCSSSRRADVSRASPPTAGAAGPAGPASR